MGGLVSMSTRRDTTALCSGVHWIGDLDESWPPFMRFGLVVLDLAGVALWLDSVGLSISLNSGLAILEKSCMKVL